MVHIVLDDDEAKDLLQHLDDYDSVYPVLLEILAQIEGDLIEKAKGTTK